MVRTFMEIFLLFESWNNENYAKRFIIRRNLE